MKRSEFLKLLYTRIDAHIDNNRPGNLVDVLLDSCEALGMIPPEGSWTPESTGELAKPKFGLSESRPREWFIERGSFIAYEPGTSGVEESECIRVVDYDSYQELLEKNVQLENNRIQLGDVDLLDEDYADPANQMISAVLYDQLENELEQLKEKHSELLSYMPKVPTQPYEKELAQKVEQLTAALNRIALLGSGPKAYTSDFTNEVMGIVRGVLK